MEKNKRKMSVITHDSISNESRTNNTLLGNNTNRFARRKKNNTFLSFSLSFRQEYSQNTEATMPFML